MLIHFLDGLPCKATIKKKINLELGVIWDLQCDITSYETWQPAMDGLISIRITYSSLQCSIAVVDTECFNSAHLKVVLYWLVSNTQIYIQMYKMLSSTVVTAAAVFVK